MIAKRFGNWRHQASDGPQFVELRIPRGNPVVESAPVTTPLIHGGDRLLGREYGLYRPGVVRGTRDFPQR